MHTISIILDDDQPEKGSIEFMGERIERTDPEKIVGLGLSQVPEGRQLFPKLTVHRALSIAEFGYILEHGRVVLADTTQKLMNQEDVKEFYLGIAADVSVKGYKRYKRKKRWR